MLYLFYALPPKNHWQGNNKHSNGQMEKQIAPARSWILGGQVYKISLFTIGKYFFTRGKYFLLDKVIHLGSHISSHMDPSHTQKLISLAGDQESM